MKFNADTGYFGGRLIWLFIMGIILLVFGIQQVLIIWKPKSSLIPLTGVLRSCETYVTTVSDKNRFGYETISQKSELEFYLYEHKFKFALSENIGDDYSNENYETIKKQLNRADSVTVWIKKSELDTWEPKVFQIDTDRGTILNFQTIRFKDRPITVFLLVVGLICLIFPVYIAFPGLFGKQDSN